MAVTSTLFSLAVLVTISQAQTDVQDRIITRPLSPSHAYDYKLSTDKFDYEYVPLGCAPASEPVELDIGVLGPSTGHALHMVIAADSVGFSGNEQNKVTGILSDNKRVGGVDQSRELTLLYKRLPGNPRIFYYLRLSPDYILCKETTCKDSNHTVRVRSEGLTPNFWPGSKPIGRDPSFDPNTYLVAQMVHLSDDTIKTVGSKYDFSTDKTDVDYFPIAMAHTSQSLSVDLTIVGPQTGHGIHLDITADYFSTAVKEESLRNKVTVYLRDHKGNVAPESNDRVSNYFSVIYQQVEGKPGNAYYYLKIDPKYIQCADTNEQCLKGKNTITMAVRGKTFIGGEKAGGFDPKFDTRKDTYEPARIVELARLQDDLDTNYRMQLTQDKTDVDYVPLGSQLGLNPLAFDIFVDGWGTNFGMRVEIVGNGYNAAAHSGQNRYTAFVKRNDVGFVHDQQDHIEFLFHKIDTRYYFYLKFNASMINCNGLDACLNSKHFATINHWAGPNYIRGNMVDGFDADFASNVDDYQVATKVDMVEAAQISVMKETIAKNEADLKKMTQRFNLLNTRLQALESWMKTPAERADVDGAKGVECAAAGDCQASVATDGSAGNLMLDSKGAEVVFETYSCAPTDLCELARDVKGLKDKFTPPP
eukprot:m.337911 g.337911  ORF g.337911 m.337911 type:complete len:646 (+) comp18268_c0_seq1:74-2011(+)